MSPKIWRLALALFIITTISGIVNVEASGGAPSLLGIKANHGIFFIHAMRSIKSGDYVKIVPQQHETLPQQQETVPQQQKFVTPAIQGEIPKPITLILYIEEVRPDGSVISVSGANVTGQEGAGNSFQKAIGNNGYMTVNGTSGTWSFIASAPGYVTYNWSQPITNTCIKDAFLQPEASRNGQLKG